MGNATPRLDWDAIDLVVFDLDGTLYDQARLRLRMLAELGIHTCRTFSVGTALTLRSFRRLREELSRTSAKADFTELQYVRTASARAVDPADVRAIVKDWIEERPLAFLRNYRFDGVAELFEACRRAGKGPAVWSDYPATAKLDALGLSAPIVLHSGEEGVQRLKPDPAGLRRICAITGARPDRILMIGDRAEHDGEAAKAAGAQALIRAKGAHPEYATFASYRDPRFEPLLRQVPAGRRSTAVGGVAS